MQSWFCPPGTYDILKELYVVKKVKKIFSFLFDWIGSLYRSNSSHTMRQRYWVSNNCLKLSIKVASFRDLITISNIDSYRQLLRCIWAVQTFSKLTFYRNLHPSYTLCCWAIVAYRTISHFVVDVGVDGVGVKAGSEGRKRAGWLLCI